MTRERPRSPSAPIGTQVAQSDAVDCHSCNSEATMFQSILVPLDGSKFGEQALPLAVGLAAKSGAKLHLAEVSNPVVVGSEMGVVAVVETRPPEVVRVYLDGITNQLAAELPNRAKCHVLSGPTIETLGKFVADHHVDLIVMTTHGRGPLKRAWLGSVADELTRTVMVPVLLFRPKEGGEGLSKGQGF